jgi:hypothetical protein
MLIQQSVFTIHGNTTPLEDLPDANVFLRKYIIPAQSKPTILRQLAAVGFGPHTLFPDLEYLARYLATEHFAG